jgi:glucose/arabinose dehydrogenase
MKTKHPDECGTQQCTSHVSRGGWLALVAMLGGAAVLGAASLPPGFREQLVASGISEGTAMEFTPDGRLFICEQGGAVRVVKNGNLLPGPFVSVPAYNFAERGLIGIAVDPGFATNHFIYLNYSVATTSVLNRVSRFTADGDVAATGSEAVLLELDEVTAPIHNGGAIHFGADGKLYVAVGESGDPSRAQSMETRLGKLLRINSDGSIPADNPFYDSASGVNRAIWALGLRNPYTFAVEPGTGRIFINDVGAGTWEEINEGVPGVNYGWPNCEGACDNASYRDPIFQYGHGGLPTNGCAISGSAFYSPASGRFPAEYSGDYFFADLCGGWIRRLNPDNQAVADFASDILGPVDLKVSHDGRLYYLARGANQVWAIDYPNAGPALAITRQNTEIVVRWPAPSPDYVLESAATLPPAGGWQPVTNSVSTSEGEHRVTLTASAAARFFRLTRP